MQPTLSIQPVHVIATDLVGGEADVLLAHLVVAVALDEGLRWGVHADARAVPSAVDARFLLRLLPLVAGHLGETGPCKQATPHLEIAANPIRIIYNPGLDNIERP
jgi:hypothetical protein